MQLSTYARFLSVAGLVVMPSLLFAAKDAKTMDNPRIAIVYTNKIMPNAFTNMQALTVDMKALSTACEEWREVFEKLNETLQSGADEFNKTQQQFKEKEEELTKLFQSGLSSESALRERAEKELAPLGRKLETMSQQRRFYAQNELTNAQAKIDQKLKKIIENLAKDQGWKLILPGEYVLWAGKEFDITDEVLKALNKGYAEEKSKKSTSAKPATK